MYTHTHLALLRHPTYIYTYMHVYTHNALAFLWKEFDVIMKQFLDVAKHCASKEYQEKKKETRRRASLEGGDAAGSGNADRSMSPASQRWPLM